MKNERKSGGGAHPFLATSLEGEDMMGVRDLGSKTSWKNF
jgi:hypothetical protein